MSWLTLGDLPATIGGPRQATNTSIQPVYLFPVTLQVPVEDKPAPPRPGGLLPRPLLTESSAPAVGEAPSVVAPVLLAALVLAGLAYLLGR